MIDKDIVAKKTIKTLLKDLAKYILNLKISNIEFIDKELQRVEKREADIVAKCQINGVIEIIHIEIQNSYDKDMPLRMLRYYTDIKLIYPDIPIRQYLIYIGRTKCYIKDRITDRDLTYSYNLIDMHTIDCQKFLSMDRPDALVLSILCDFKGRDELDIISYILNRLNQLVKDTNRLREYIEILEILSKNRNLKDKIKEVAKMIRNTRYEELPSYEIGLERGLAKGLERGLEQGLEQGKLESAITMIKEFGLSKEDVALKLNLPLDELNRYLNKSFNNEDNN